MQETRDQPLINESQVIPALRKSQRAAAYFVRLTCCPPLVAMLNCNAGVLREKRGERESNLLVIIAYCQAAGIPADILIDDRWKVKDLSWAISKDGKKPV